MNLKSKIVIITLMAVVALVGVGYATWTFNTEKSADVAATGLATAAIEANSVQVKSGDNVITQLYIICDQPTKDGIYWATDANGEHAITQVTLVGVVNEDDNDILDFETYTGTFTCTAAAVSGTWVNVAAVSLNQDATASAGSNVELVFDLPALSYKATPENVAQVNLLETEVNALALTYTFSFAVKSVA